MHTTYIEKLNERVVRTTTPSGLEILIIPKPGFHKTEIHLAIGFGSIDEDHGADPESSFPTGTAHFLEHMLFEAGATDPTAAFARLGAQVNAYTSFDTTVYYFSTTEDERMALDLLINLVFQPEIPAAAVEKERDIISREIHMYEDDVNDLIYENLLNAMYQTNPVKNPIAGTIASIATIDATVLKNAHAAYYLPANAHVVVVGDVDPDAVIRAIESHPVLQTTDRRRPKRKISPEDHVPAKRFVEKKKDIKNDLLMLGIKFDRPSGQTAFENDLEEIKWAFLLDAIFGKASLSYQDLIRKRLVNDAFEASAQSEPDFGHIVIYTETKKPQAAMKAIWALFDMPPP
ncbi:MAG: pitrilysin family protein [bacterium]